MRLESRPASTSPMKSWIRVRSSALDCSASGAVAQILIGVILCRVVCVCVCYHFPTARNAAMTSLSQAVQSGARAEATTQARVIVDVHTPLPPIPVSPAMLTPTLCRHGSRTGPQAKGSDPPERIGRHQKGLGAARRGHQGGTLQLAHQAVRHCCSAAAGVLIV
jgi:hypothetical protein